MSFISIRGLIRRTETRTILKDVNLDVEEGDILGIIGPSGSGKTSLLRVINMLDRPDAGSILINGKGLWSNDRLEIQRTMAMVFQKPVAFAMSVYDNVAYGLRLRGARRDEIDHKVREALRMLDMEGRESQYAKSLSGGELQRVAFARAYVLQPRLLLLDEPTANLDPANASIIERAVRDVNARHGGTVIMVTHDVHQARRLASRSGFMMGGEIVEVGPSREFFESPRDPRTSMFLRGELVC